MIRRMFVAGMGLALAAAWPRRQEVKVGVVLPYTGIGAEFAQQMDRGMEQYLKLNADEVKPVLRSRSSNATPEDPGGADAKTAVQELLSAGKGRCARWLGLLAKRQWRRRRSVAAGKKLAVIMNAGTAFITDLAPEYVRAAFSMWRLPASP